MPTREECLTELADFMLVAAEQHIANGTTVAKTAPPIAAPRAARTSGIAPQLLKVAEVADRLSVGIDWVYERIKRGEIPVVELGATRKNQRIRESDLEAFIEARTYGR